MASIFRPTYWHVDKTTGKRTKRKYKVWYVKYRDENGKRKSVPGYCDKEATRQHAAALERRVARIKAGLVDPFENHIHTPIGEHVEGFKRHLEAKNNSEDYIKLTLSRVGKILAGCEFSSLRDFSADAVEDWLTAARRRETNPLSKQTSNYYLKAIRNFTKWLAKSNRAPRDYLIHVSYIHNEDENSRPRRAISNVEFANLIRATRARKDRRKLNGKDRAMIYMLSAYTGYRAEELSSLTPNSFDFEELSVSVTGGYSKRKRLDTQPLRHDLAEAFKQYLKGRDPDSPIWPGRWYRRGAEMLYEDTKAAGIPKHDSRGRVFDFHALRHTYITNLHRSGTYGKLLQEMARHSTPMLTARYTHVDLADVHAALEGLPSLPLEDESKLKSDRKTG